MPYEPIKTPVKYQREAAECSAVALWIILAYYGKYVPIDELRTACNVSRGGTTYLDMVQAGRLYGLEAKGLKRSSIASLREIKPPFVVYYNYNHSVVVEGVTEDCLYVNEGGMGRMAQTYEAFDDGFTGVVLTFYPSESFKKDGRKREFKVLKDLRKFFRENNAQKFREKFFGIPMQYFYQNGYTQPSYLIHAQQFVARQIPVFCVKMLGLVGLTALFCALLLLKNPFLGLIALLCMALSAFSLMRIWEISVPLFKDVWEDYSLQNAHFPYFSNTFKRAKVRKLEEARIFGLYSWKVQKLAGQTPVQAKVMAKDAHLLGATLALPLFALGWPAATMGEFLSVLGIVWGIWQTRGLLPKMQNTYSLMNEVMRVVLEYKDVSQEQAVLPVAADAAAPLLYIKDLRFDFKAGSEIAINGFDLTLKKGEMLAIVGKSGSGKSVLAQLLAGLHRPQSGEILLQGTPLHEWPPAQRAQIIGMVVQQSLLFTGTVRENIGQGLSNEALLQAMQTACIEPGAIAIEDAVQESGRNFTHSQRQRLELARALAKQPQLLILDEATNGLSNELERLILQNIRKSGIACLFIAHRLDNIDLLDRVIEMNNGKASEYTPT